MLDYELVLCALYFDTRLFAYAEIGRRSCGALRRMKCAGVGGVI